MSTSLMPTPKQQYFDSPNGRPLEGGKVYTYAAGTSTPKATYSDSAGTTPQANPIILNARGEPASAIYWDGAYKVTVTDSVGNVIYAVDNYISTSSEVATGLAAAIAAIAAYAASIAASTGASLMGWIRSATGAVVTTIEKWLNWQPINAFEFMTAAQIADVQAGTLLIDVTTFVQNAITAVAARPGKGLVILPKGKYKITTALQIPYGVSIRGEGATASELVCYNCNGLNFTTYGYEIGSMFYEDFGITSGAGLNYSAVTALPNASTMDGLHFNRLRFYGWNECFNLAANWNSSIQNCTAQNINCFIAASGVIVGLRILNNRVVYGAGGAGVAAKIGIDIRGGTIQEAIQILDNYIYGFDYAISATAVSLYISILHNDLSALVITIQYTTVNGAFNVCDNYIEAFGIGISGMPQSVDTPTTKINIERNDFSGQGGAPSVGLQLNSAIGTYQFNTHISKNTFTSFLTHDIRVYAGGRTFIDGNRCMSSAPAQSIWIGGVVAGPVKVSDNWCAKLIYVDVAADITTGKLVLTSNVESDTFVPYRGSFAPVYSSQVGAFGAITYSYANGSYERIGNLCFFNLTIVAATLAVGTAANGARISLGNIPFTAAATVQAQAVSIADATGWGANTPNAAAVASGTKDILLWHRATSNGASVATQVADMTAGAGNRITIAGVFLCA